MKTHSADSEHSKSIFVSLLHQELKLRQKKNPLYSIRAFARCLDVDQSLLTKILRGQRYPSTSLIVRAKDRLRMDLKETLKKTDKSTLQYRRIEDTFHLLSEWYHFAILEIVNTADFQRNTKWIANRLNLPRSEVEIAISRLLRLKLLAIEEDGWRVLEPNLTWSNSKKTSAARKMYQKSLALMSLEALDEVEFARRDHSSLTIALDPNLIPELKEKFTEFRRSLNQFISERNSSPKEVYHFTFSFYPVSGRKKEKLQ